MSSPDDDMISIIAAIQGRLDKKQKQRERKLQLDCEKTIQSMESTATEFVQQRTTNLNEIIHENQRKIEELAEERTSLLLKLQTENEKFQTLFESCYDELLKIEVTKRKLEEKFVTDLGSQFEGLGHRKPHQHGHSHKRNVQFPISLHFVLGSNRHF
ncbi:hypothetical protein BKA69DRAFT_506783 [Paraphysoderma sedebokerense]|nr:hypothetical protein BKA69DRAFT_506783 [Paraphysoderma sedebokerense]